MGLEPIGDIVAWRQGLGTLLPTSTLEGLHTHTQMDPKLHAQVSSCVFSGVFAGDFVSLTMWAAAVGVRGFTFRDAQHALQARGT